MTEGTEHISEKRRRSTKAVINENGQRVTPVTQLPASQRVEARKCTSCLSPDTFVYATRQVARYCKCRRCGHTFTIGPGVTTVDEIQTR
jgi:hypothetical protein